MSELKEAAGLALQATAEIQRWSEKILERIESRLKAKGELSIDYTNYSFGASALSFPNWAGRCVGPKDTNWGGGGEPPEQVGFFMISFRPKPQSQW